MYIKQWKDHNKHKYIMLQLPSSTSLSRINMYSHHIIRNENKCVQENSILIPLSISLIKYRLEIEYNFAPHHEKDYFNWKPSIEIGQAI